VAKFSETDLDEIDAAIAARQNKHIKEYWQRELERLGPDEPLKWWDDLFCTDRWSRNIRRAFARRFV
jgi:hypothetical protein